MRRFPDFIPWVKTKPTNLACKKFITFHYVYINTSPWLCVCTDAFWFSKENQSSIQEYFSNVLLPKKIEVANIHKVGGWWTFHDISASRIFGPSVRPTLAARQSLTSIGLRKTGVALFSGRSRYFIFPTSLSNLVVNDQQGTDGSYSRTCGRKRTEISAKSVFMSGKDVNDKVWCFEPRKGDGQGMCR